MSYKNFNIDSFNFHTKTKFLKKKIKIISLIILVVVIFLVFLGALYICKNVISNKEKLFVLLGNDSHTYLTTSCIKLDQHDRKLVYELVNLLEDSKYYSGNKVANIQFLNLPASLARLNDNKNILIRKEVFIKSILPLIIIANNTVIVDRQKVLYLNSRMPKEELNNNDMEIFNYLATKYNLKQKINTPWDVLSGINELVVKVNPIPNSLVLAVAIKETGWGKSRFLQDGNSLFSEWTYEDNKNKMEPLNKNKDAKYGVKRYKNLGESVTSFFYNLNAGDNYSSFRNVRFKQLISISGINVLKLADTLEKYAESSNYAEGLKSIIKDNNLTKYDKYNAIDTTKKPVCLYFH